MRKSMKTYLAIILGVLAIPGTAAAQGTVPCFWSAQNADQSAVTVKTGETVRVTVVTGARGELKLPEGWVSDGFTPGACVGFPDPQKCGRWEAHYVASGGPTVVSAAIAVENARCTPSTRVITITVEAPPAPPPVVDPNAAFWTRTEKDQVQEHIRKAPAGEGNVEMAAGFATIANMHEQTRWGKGFQASVGGKPVRTKDGLLGLKVDATFRIWTSGAPIDEALRPTSMDVDMLVHTESLRAFFDITPLTWLQFDLGLGCGVMTESWNQKVVSQQQNGIVTLTENKTQTVGTIDPTIQGTLIFGKYVGLRLEGSYTQPLAGRMTTVGSQSTSVKGFPGGMIGMVGQF